ncbi:unnamed protein product, partial [Protopolystoma xenopodis]
MDSELITPPSLAVGECSLDQRVKELIASQKKLIEWQPYPSLCSRASSLADKKASLCRSLCHDTSSRLYGAGGLDQTEDTSRSMEYPAIDETILTTVASTSAAKDSQSVRETDCRCLLTSPFRPFDLKRPVPVEESSDTDELQQLHQTRTGQTFSLSDGASEQQSGRDVHTVRKMDEETRHRSLIVMKFEPTCPPQDAYDCPEEQPELDLYESCARFSDGTNHTKCFAIGCQPTLKEDRLSSSAGSPVLNFTPATPASGVASLHFIRLSSTTSSPTSSDEVSKSDRSYSLTDNHVTDFTSLAVNSMETRCNCDAISAISVYDDEFNAVVADDIDDSWMANRGRPNLVVPYALRLRTASVTSFVTSRSTNVVKALDITNRQIDLPTIRTSEALSDRFSLYQPYDTSKQGQPPKPRQSVEEEIKELREQSREVLFAPKPARKISHQPQLSNLARSKLMPPPNRAPPELVQRPRSAQGPIC